MLLHHENRKLYNQLFVVWCLCENST